MRGKKWKNSEFCPYFFISSWDLYDQWLSGKYWKFCTRA